MKRTATLALALVAASGIGLFAIRDASKADSSNPPASPEAIATNALNSGLKRLGNGDKAELKAAAQTKPSNVQKSRKRARGEYEKAVADFKKAIGLVPHMYRAYNGMGHAYLGLNRLDEAKQAYLLVFAGDRTNATVLMKAMKAWAEKRRADPAGVDPSTLNAFEEWVNERADLAAKTVNMAHNAPDWK